MCVNQPELISIATATEPNTTDHLFCPSTSTSMKHSQCSGTVVIYVQFCSAFPLEHFLLPRMTDLIFPWSILLVYKSVRCIHLFFKYFTESLLCIRPLWWPEKYSSKQETKPLPSWSLHLRRQIDKSVKYGVTFDGGKCDDRMNAVLSGRPSELAVRDDPGGWLGCPDGLTTEWGQSGGPGRSTVPQSAHSFQILRFWRYAGSCGTVTGMCRGSRLKSSLNSLEQV